MKKQEKTNVMRVLDQKKVEYAIHDYTDTGMIAGDDVAKVLGEDPNSVFKTLVTIGKSKTNYVFLVPVSKELDLKKAAAAVGEKNIEMIKAKELLPLTGYVHGGCSPIGMKKFFKTVIDESFLNFERVCFSGGKVGMQVEMKGTDLEKVIRYSTAQIAKDPE